MSDREAFDKWLQREMPAGTVISDPLWWAPRILKAAQAQAGDGEAVGEVFEVLCKGRIVYVEVYDGAVIPHGSKLYLYPKKVNNQLINALDNCAKLIACTSFGECKNFDVFMTPMVCLDEARAAIAVAQEGK
jgi:hypothetical protein